MKLIRKIFILGISLFGLFPIAISAQEGGNKSCDTAAPLTDEVTFYSGDFSMGGLVQPANFPICMSVSQNLNVREFWYEFTSDGISNYYFYIDGIVGALEIYAGKCRNPTLVTCYPSSETYCYAELLSPPEGTYLVRLVGLVIPNLSTYNLDFNSVDPTPFCNISIDNYSIYPCVDEDGKIAVTISGSLDNSNPQINPFVEIETDFGSYFSLDVQGGSTWTANVQVEGTLIENIVVAYGNSSNYCIDVVSNIPLPTETCSSTSASLTGVFEWNSACLARPGYVSLYQPGTANLVAYYSVDILGSGEFLIYNPLLGTYDIIVKVDGYLPKGFPNVTIENLSNQLTCGALTAGELNGDSYINISDASAISNWYGQDTNPDYLQFDLNCDGIINVFDISAFGSVYGLSGAIAPLIIE